MKRTYIQQMADFVSSLKYEDLPSDVVLQAKTCIIDALECNINTMTDERGEAAFLSPRKNLEGMRSTLFRKKAKADAADAAYYNSVKQSITSRNDTSLNALCHPGAVIVPTVIALAEEFNASGKRIIEAVVAGYETMIRFGTFLVGRTNRAWRTTALFGPVGAAFAAAKIAGLDADGIASSASFACHLLGGVNEWALSGTGEDVFQNANGARNGILAMRLAKNGAKGCPTILEGSGGLAAAYGIKDGYELLTKDFGKQWMILNVIQKPMTSCIAVQNSCQTALIILNRHPEIKFEDIDHVDFFIGRANYQQFGCANNEIVENIVQAIMSIAYGVANSIIYRSVDNLNYMPPYEPKVLAFMRKCTPYIDEELTKKGGFPSRVSIFLKSGAVYTEEKDAVTPLTRDEVLKKFLVTASDEIGKTQAEKVFDSLINLENLDSIDEVARLLG